MKLLSLRNRQRVRRVDVPLLRRLVLDLLADFFNTDDYELCIHLVGAEEMARVNEHYLDHEGSTDVITFSHLEPPDISEKLHGELFVCIDDAVSQARQFRTSWQAEMVRYIIHGVLHLRGHDDLGPRARRLMKREENRIVREAGGRFRLSKLERKTPRPGERLKIGVEPARNRA